MQLRDKETTTLGEVVDAWRRRYSRWGGGIHLVDVAFEDKESPHFVFGDHEVPVTDLGIEALGRFLGMPVRYLLKIPNDERQFMFTKRIERTGEQDLQVFFTSQGVQEIVAIGKRRIEPQQVAEQALQTLPEDSVVLSHWATTSDLRLDVIVPEDDSLHYATEMVGRARAGLRFGQNRKQNLAPWVQPLIYFEEQTNVFELTDPGFKVDARGMGEDDLLMALGTEADRALKRATDKLGTFFHLRSQKVGSDPTGVLRRITRDAGLPERTVSKLADGLPEVISALDEVTMFDFANHVANYANVLSEYSGATQTIQQAAGSLISDHVARCAACHRRVDL